MNGPVYTWLFHVFSLIGYLSDLLKTFPFTLGHINLHKMAINPIFNSRAVYKFNEVHVNEINYQLISRSKTAIGERAASALER